MIQGFEHEELFTLDETSDCLVEAGSSTNPHRRRERIRAAGRYHRVRNSGSRTAISIHVYGTDVSRIGSSVRRYYDLPVRPASSAA